MSHVRLQTVRIATCSPVIVLAYVLKLYEMRIVGNDIGQSPLSISILLLRSQNYKKLFKQQNNS